MKTQWRFFNGFHPGLWVLFFALCSCDNHLNITMPQGPQGPAGASAYQVWVQAVNDGIVEWDRDRTDIGNYFLFLKGKDGTEGKSAYELWVKEVGKGIDDPHNAGEKWSEDRTGVEDFWYFLTGAKGQKGDDGKSAYELWKAEVEAGKVEKDGEQWPTDKNTVPNFWEYLTGKDGADCECGEIGCDCAKVPAVRGIQPMKKSSLGSTLAAEQTALANKAVDETAWQNFWVRHSSYAPYEGFVFAPQEAVTKENTDLVERITIPFWRQRFEFTLSCRGSDIEVVLADGDGNLSGSWVDAARSDADYLHEEVNGTHTRTFRISFEANDLPGEQFRELTLRFRNTGDPTVHRDIRIRQIYLPNMLSRYSKANVAELNTFGADITESNFAALTGADMGYYYQWGRNIPVRPGQTYTQYPGQLETGNEPALWDGNVFIYGNGSTGYIPESVRKAGTSWSSMIEGASGAPPSYVGVNDDPAAKIPGASPYGDPCPAGWHLPNRDEYYAFVVGYKDFSGDEYMQFGRSYNSSLNEATAGVSSETYAGIRWDYWWKKYSRAYYKSSGTYTAWPDAYDTYKPMYAVKFVSNGNNDVYENALRGAFKYEMLKNAGDQYYLKISYRHLGEYTGMTAEELETLSNSGYWDSNNGNDITAIVPLYGLADFAAEVPTAYQNVSGFYWSSEIRMIQNRNPNAVTFLIDGPNYDAPRNGHQRRASASAQWSFSNNIRAMLRCIRNAQDPEIPDGETSLPAWN